MRRYGSVRPMMVGALLSGALVAACSPAPKQAVETAPRLSLEQRLAQTTAWLVNVAVVSYDTASVQAGYATIDAPLQKVHEYAATARETTKRASQSIEDAILAGDRLRTQVEPDGIAAGPRRYSHYWYLGKAKLDVARLESERAVIAADSVLACTAPSCTTAPARSFRTHSVAAAGAAREAESLVRLAMVYVK